MVDVVVGVVCGCTMSKCLTGRGVSLEEEPVNPLNRRFGHDTLAVVGGQSGRFRQCVILCLFSNFISVLILSCFWLEPPFRPR